MKTSYKHILFVLVSHKKEILFQRISTTNIAALNSELYLALLGKGKYNFTLILVV